MDGAAQCWVKRGGGATLQNPDRGAGKVSPEYLARGCPPSLAGEWGTSVLALLALVAAGYVAGGSVVGSRAKGESPRLRNHPHFLFWHELKGLCQDGAAFARSGTRQEPLLRDRGGRKEQGRGADGGRRARGKGERRSGDDGGKERARAGGDRPSGGEGPGGGPTGGGHSGGAASRGQRSDSEETGGGPGGDGGAPKKKPGGRWVHVGS